ncbi:MAG: hypothetical protein COA57_01455 [Flavobacteriales bacterium]|nr:MAG: hypothetical protein COA57_01455 [Flavobacteriales bacterium]
MFVSNLSYGQKDILQEQALTEMFRCVVYLQETKVQTFKKDGKEYERWLKDVNNNEFSAQTYPITGTGFFASDDEGSFYLVTAQHVAKDLTINATVTIQSKYDKPITYSIKDLVGETDALKWTTHGSADVAVLLIDLNSKIFDIPMLSALPPHVILDSLQAPKRQKELTIVGFPLGLGIGKKFSPISKKLSPSSGLFEGINPNNNLNVFYFLLDDPSVAGFSGSPVYDLVILPQQEGESEIGVLRCVGLVQGTISDKIAGFAAIVPSVYISRTIAKAPKYSGVVVYYHDNGKIWSELLFKNGKEWKVISNYDSNGKPMEKGTLNNGNGTRYEYDKEGELVFIQHYESGKLVKTVKQEN